MRTSLFVVASLFTAGTAAADQVGVVVTGEATLQPQVAAQLDGWLRDRGHNVVPGPLEPQAINTLIDCFVLEDLGCARGVVDARSKSRSLVYARIDAMPAEDGTRDVSITGHWFQKNHDAVAERRECKGCDSQKLHDTIDALMLALVHEPPPPLPGAEKPPTPPPGDIEEESPSRLVPIGVASVGAAAIVAGIVMIAIDEDPDPVGRQEAEYRDTATGGVVIGLVGTALVGAGAYLWLRERPSSQPVASVSRDGGFIGWAGSF